MLVKKFKVLKIKVQIISVQKDLGSIKILSPKNFWYKTDLVLKIRSQNFFFEFTFKVWPKLSR